MEPVFIGGCDRSGTTLLRLMLIKSPDLYIPGETTFLPILCENKEEWGDFSEPFQRWFFVRDLQKFQATTRNTAFEVFDITPKEAEEAIAAIAPTDYPGASAAIFLAAAKKKGKPRWGDKSPANVMHMEYLSQAFPKAKFIHIIRDPRDVTASIRKAGWMRNYREAAGVWKLRVETGMRVGAQLGEKKYREIRYEELVHDPEKELHSLCDWLEITYSPEMLEFYTTGMDHLPGQVQFLFEKAKGPADTSRAQAWKRTMSRSHIADVESIAGDLMERIGYPKTGARISLWTRMRRFFFDRIRPVAVWGADYAKRLG